MQDKDGNVEIGYFTVRRTSDETGYIGAILVIDASGIPKEFRCTHPVKPSAPQRALYGNNLEPYIFFELCGRPLVNAISSHPSAMIVESREFLSLREYVNIPVIQFEKLGEIFVVGADIEGKQTAYHQSRLDSVGGGFDPLGVDTMQGFESDYESTKAPLEIIYERVDLFEPFERITTALRVLAERDERFR